MYSEMLPIIKNYLDACTNIMSDGSAKADAHAKLVEIHLKHHGGDADEIRRNTRALTDRLDETVGLDLNEIPSYNVFCPIFYHKWCLITQIIKEAETPKERMMRQVKSKRIGYADGILNSYGYRLREHSESDAESLWSVYTNRSGNKIKVTANKFFGCTVQELSHD